MDHENNIKRVYNDLDKIDKKKEEEKKQKHIKITKILDFVIYGLMVAVGIVAVLSYGEGG